MRLAVSWWCRWMMVGAAALGLGAGGAVAQAALGTAAQGRWQPPPPPQSWKAPEVKGYTDGVKAGWMDLAARAKPHPERQLLYRKPPASIGVGQRYFYREGFRKGYDVVYAHHRLGEQRGASAKQGQGGAS